MRGPSGPPAASCFGLHARARSTALGRRRAPAFVWLSDSLRTVRDVFVVTAPVTPGSPGTSSSGTTREWPFEALACFPREQPARPAPAGAIAYCAMVLGVVGCLQDLTMDR
jgi:hypothetical protein